jgi:hypothetical protein
MAIKPSTMHSTLSGNAALSLGIPLETDGDTLGVILSLIDQAGQTKIFLHILLFLKSEVNRNAALRKGGTT